MEPLAIKALSSLFAYGPLGILAALGFVLYFLQTRKTDAVQKSKDELSEKLSEKLYEVSSAAILADEKHSQAYVSLEKFFDAVLKAIVEKKE